MILYSIQTMHYSGVWTNAWRNIVGLDRALTMQQELEYEAGTPARIPYPARPIVVKVPGNW